MRDFPRGALRMARTTSNKVNAPTDIGKTIHDTKRGETVEAEGVAVGYSDVAACGSTGACEAGCVAAGTLVVAAAVGLALVKGAEVAGIGIGAGKVVSVGVDGETTLDVGVGVGAGVGGGVGVVAGTIVGATVPIGAGVGSGVGVPVGDGAGSGMGEGGGVGWGVGTGVGVVVVVGAGVGLGVGVGVGVGTGAGSPSTVTVPIVIVEGTKIVTSHGTVPSSTVALMTWPTMLYRPGAMFPGKDRVMVWLSWTDCPFLVGKVPIEIV